MNVWTNKSLDGVLIQFLMAQSSPTVLSLSTASLALAARRNVIYYTKELEYMIQRPSRELSRNPRDQALHAALQTLSPSTNTMSPWIGMSTSSFSTPWVMDLHAPMCRAAVGPGPLSQTHSVVEQRA
jgi:hypothetical protein